MHLLERRKTRCVCEDGMKMIEGLVQPAENIQDKDVVKDVDAEVDEGVGETLHL
jgi:hypothetical protein